jgi:hypothetical protein
VLDEDVWSGSEANKTALALPPVVSLRLQVTVARLLSRHGITRQLCPVKAAAEGMGFGLALICRVVTASMRCCCIHPAAAAAAAAAAQDV